MKNSTDASIVMEKQQIRDLKRMTLARFWKEKFTTENKLKVGSINAKDFRLILQEQCKKVTYYGG